ncbi:MAG: hypothetical protein AAGI46_17060, partial [Planctomycetota bacterium]
GVVAVVDAVDDPLAVPAKPGPLERSAMLSVAARITLVFIALPFWAEFFLRIVWIERGRSDCRVPAWRRTRLAHLLAVALVPPLRPTLGPASMRRWNWLPGLGWRRDTRELARKVQRAIGGPMLFIALLILPVLLVQMLFDDVVQNVESLALALDVAIRLIWLAFTVEFLVVLSVTPRKLEHAIKHWVDLIIILLPFAAFARTLRLVRLGQLMRAGQMTKLASTYRLRGLAVKLMQAVLMLRVLESVSGSMARRRIAKIEETIERRREEIADLEQERREVRSDLARRLAEQRAKKRAEAAAKSDVEEPIPAATTTPVTA